MAMIDDRLLDCDGEQEFTENFNRVLNIVDTKGSKNAPLDKLFLKDSTTGKICGVELKNGVLTVNVPSGELTKAIMCFIDDDAQTGSNDLFNMLEELGVPYGISVPVSTIGTSGHLSLAQLNTHKSNGADILMHGALGSEDYKTMSLDAIKNSIDTALTFATTNNFNKEVFVYPSGLQPTTNEGNMTDVFDYMLSKGIKYGLNVNTVGESSSTSGVEDWYTYDNGQACAGVWNKVPYATMPNNYSKKLLLNRQQYSSNFFYRRKSYWFNNIQNLINSKGIMFVFTHGYNLNTTVTTYDGETTTLLDSYKDFITYIQTECADTIEILSPLTAFSKIENGGS